MNADQMLERRLRVSLQAALEEAPLPNPTWSDSPAARRVAGTLRSRRLPLRLLAVAAVLVIGGAAAAGAWLMRPPPPEPDATGNGWVAFTEWNGWTRDIWFVREGVSPSRVIGYDGDYMWETCPAFSADGTMLAYSEAPDDSSDSPVWNLTIVPLDDNGLPRAVPDRVAISEAGADCPVWSPDGRCIAFGATSGLHLVDLDTRQDLLVAGHGRRDARPDDFSISDFEWAPDGQSLAYVKSTPTLDESLPTLELWKVTLAGDQTLLADLLLNERVPSLERVPGSLAWAPDGSHIAIGGSNLVPRADGFHPGTFEIQLVDATGANGAEEINSWQASDYGLNQGLAFSPDGARLAYIREGVLIVRALDGQPSSVSIDGLGRSATAACLNGWSAAGDRLLVVVADQPYLDRGVNSALVEVDPGGQMDTVILLPWGSPYAGTCGANWQEGDTRQIKPMDVCPWPLVAGECVAPSPSSPFAPGTTLRPTRPPSDPPVPVTRSPSRSGHSARIAHDGFEQVIWRLVL